MPPSSPSSSPENQGSDITPDLSSSPSLEAQPPRPSIRAELLDKGVWVTDSGGMEVVRHSDPNE